MIAILAPLILLAAEPGAAAPQPAPPPVRVDLIPGRPAVIAGVRAANVFISPAGEPFRAPPEEPYPVGAWFSRADADHDGAVNREEFKADSLAFFDRLDANHDGVIDGFELGDYERKVAPEIQPTLGAFEEAPEPPPTRVSEVTPHVKPVDHRKRKGPAVKGAAVFGLLLDPEPVASADTDLDGKVTRKEAEAAANRRFDRLDANHDGRLTMDELPQTPAQALKKRE
jgi:hypothetical protein